MTKKFTRVEPTEVQEFGLKFKRYAVIKRFRTEDGLEHEFTMINKEGSAAAAVIALTPDNRVLSMYEFRPSSESWVYEIPGGSLHDGEDPEEGAIRELREETGYVPGKIEYLGKSHDDACANMVRHYFFATDCTPDNGGHSFDQEEHEQGAEMRIITIDELIDSATGGTMTDPRAVLLAYEELKRIESGKQGL